jgi:hypothetical protein
MSIALYAIRRAEARATTARELDSLGLSSLGANHTYDTPR